MHRCSHLKRWIVVSFVGLLVFLIFFVFYIDFQVVFFFKESHGFLFSCLLCIPSLFLSLFFFRQLIQRQARSIIEKQGIKQVYAVGQNAYIETLAKHEFFLPEKLPHAVLMLHGFSVSTQEFDDLITLLKKDHVSYLAPMILGFGQKYPSNLHSLCYQDWYRECLSHFDMLSQIADKVSVVGHSMGGLLALKIACDRPVHQLILSAPACYPSPSQKKIKDMVLSWYSKYLLWILPYSAKSISEGRQTVSDVLDDSIMDEFFQYVAIPTHAVREMYRLQESLDLKDCDYNNLFILQAKHDQVVDVSALLNQLDRLKKDYKCTIYDSSAHGLLQDGQRHACVEKIHQLLVQ